MTAMMRWDRLGLAALWGIASMSAAIEAAGAQAPDPVAVELELVLAVDTSASVDNAEFRLQMGGIANAFRHEDVIAAIRLYGETGIAVTLVQWSAGDQQAQSVRWHHVRDTAGGEAFAAAVERAPRRFAVNTTAIGSALRYSTRLFSTSPYRGRRRSIDLSGDGRSNAGLIADAERDRAVAAGITVNGLAILNGDVKLERYYRINVIGGPASFVMTAENFTDFARAIRDKLLREIAPVVAQGPPGDAGEDVEQKFGVPHLMRDPERHALAVACVLGPRVRCGARHLLPEPF